MNKPDWFALIEGWKAKGMGNSGPTLPFLVGALARTSGRQPTTASEIQDLLKDMADNPVASYTIHVSWCPTIDAPVFSSVHTPRATAPLALDENGVSSEPGSLEFGRDIRSKHGFDCSQTQDCIRKLAEDAFGHVSKGNFSRNKCSTGLYEYGPFTRHEIDFIENTIGRPKR
jgi:hypothetical protein